MLSYNSFNPVNSSKYLELLNTFNKNSKPFFSYSWITILEQATHCLYRSTAGRIMENVERKLLIECGRIPKMHSFGRSGENSCGGLKNAGASILKIII